MKVLHVGAGNLYGGIEAVLTTVAAHRDAAPGVEHEFALCFEGRAARELRVAGAALHLLGEVRVRRPWTVWQARRRLAALVAARGADAVLAHGPWCHAIAAPSVRRAGRRVVMFAHDVARGAHWIERWAARHPPDLVVANSAYTGATMGVLFPGAPVRVVHCPVPPPPRSLDAGEREAIRRAHGATPVDVVIAIAARFEAWKGHDVLLRALAGVRADGWRCWVIGGAQRPEERLLRERLGTLAATLGVDGRVSWLGQREDVRALLSCADLYCQPNTGPEPFGVVLVEALHAGLPVVTSAFGGAAEIVDDACGVTLPPGDTAALAAALDALVRSPERRRSLSLSGTARARSLSDPDRQVEALAAAVQASSTVPA